jgi:hypothetical protein
MAVLDENARAEVWAQFMRDESDARQPMGLTKAELRAAFNAADDWTEAAQTSFNNALPLPARNVLTGKQKAKLLAMVLYARWGVTA